MKSRRIDREGFTLIELLVVIAVIAILAGILIPTIGAALRKVEKTEAETEARAIVTAIKAYNSQYGKLPLREGDHGESDGPVDNPDLMDVLLAADTAESRELNPRRTVFLEADGVVTNGVGFMDPWDQEYVIIMDKDYDGKTDIGSNQEVPSIAVVKSIGRDGFEGNEDDIWSFK